MAFKGLTFKQIGNTLIPFAVEVVGDKILYRNLGKLAGSPDVIVEDAIDCDFSPLPEKYFDGNKECKWLLEQVYNKSVPEIDPATYELKPNKKGIVKCNLSKYYVPNFRELWDRIIESDVEFKIILKITDSREDNPSQVFFDGNMINVVIADENYFLKNNLNGVNFIFNVMEEFYHFKQFLDGKIWFVFEGNR